jgi:hypothetical protein
MLVKLVGSERSAVLDIEQVTTYFKQDALGEIDEVLEMLAWRPEIFVLTGSIAYNYSRPNDIDFFVRYSVKLSNYFVQEGWKCLHHYSQNMKNDPSVMVVYRKYVGKTWIDVQLIREELWKEKVLLMREMHKLFRITLIPKEVRGEILRAGMKMLRRMQEV